MVSDGAGARTCVSAPSLSCFTGVGVGWDSAASLRAQRPGLLGGSSHVENPWGYRAAVC